jgi:hypothetical protein
LSSALPLSYYILDPVSIFKTSVFNFDLILPGFAVFASFTLAGHYGIRRIHFANILQISLLGFSLLFLPSALIALSAKYQLESVYGQGYLQTVLSYLGFSLLALLVVGIIHTWLKKFGEAVSASFAFLFAIMIGVIGVISTLSSYRVADTINEYWRYPREQVEVWMAIRPRNLSKNSELVVVDNSSRPRWENTNFLTQHRGVRARFADPVTDRLEIVAKDSNVDIIKLKHPTISRPSDLSLIVDSSRDANESIVRAYVISTDRFKLSQYRLGLMGDDKIHNFDANIVRGRHGYFIRKVEFRAASESISQYSLNVAPY